MENQTITIAELKMLLYKTDKYAVIGSDEYTNNDARYFLSKIGNQMQMINYIDNGSHLLIWGV